MKKYLVIAASLLIIISTQSAVADQVRMGSNDGSYRSESGGQLTYQDLASLTEVLDTKNDSAKIFIDSTNTFPSMSFEPNEHFYSNSVYAAVLDNAEVNIQGKFNNRPFPRPHPGPHPGPHPVPEPATLLLLGAGLIGLAGFTRWTFKK